MERDELHMETEYPKCTHLCVKKKINAYCTHLSVKKKIKSKAITVL